MGSSILYQPAYSIYPGEYMPLVGETELKEKLKAVAEKDIIHPPVNVTELPDSYKIEVFIPGVRREEFLVTAEQNIISVRVFHTTPAAVIMGKECPSEFGCTCYDRYIILPGNADSSFAVGEYRQGVLYMFVPKDGDNAANASAKIAIY